MRVLKWIGLVLVGILLAGACGVGIWALIPASTPPIDSGMTCATPMPASVFETVATLCALSRDFESSAASFGEEVEHGLKPPIAEPERGFYPLGPARGTAAKRRGKSRFSCVCPTW